MMSAVWMRLRAELRERWRSWVGLALLAGLAGGLVTAAAAGARRTDTAYERMLAESAPNDVFLYQYEDVGLTILDPKDVASLPQVVDSARLGWVWTGVGDAPFGVAIPADRKLGSRIDRARIIEGRRAAPDAADEATVSFAGADAFGLHIGSKIPLLPPEDPQNPSPELDQYRKAFVDAGIPLELRVVGIQLGPGDLPPIKGGLAAYATPALYEAAAKIGGLSVDSIALRLRNGADDIPAFQEGLHRLAGADFQINAIPQSAFTAGVRSAIGPLASAMWLLAALLGLSSILILGQAVARQVAISSQDLETLQALGMSRTDRWTIAIGRAIATGSGAAIVTVVVAVALSPVTPLGLARVAEPDPGIHADALVLGIAAAAVVILLVVLTAIPAWRAVAANEGPMRTSAPDARTSATASLLARSGAGVPMVAGAHLALTPGRRDTSVPVRSTIFGIALAAAALTASLGVAASFDRLLATPRLYGQAWDLRVSDYELGQDYTDRARALARRRDVAALSYGNVLGLEVGGHRAEAFALTPLVGDAYPPIVEGDRPDASDEIALGGKTLQTLRAKLGDRIEVNVQNSSSRSMRIVGRVVSPSLSGSELGETALLDWEALRGSLAETDRATSTILIRFAPGINMAAAREEVETILIPPGADPGVSLDALAVPNETPEDVVNFGRVENLPLVLSGALASLAAAVLAHMVASSVRRRRRDLAILKTLGLDRRALRAAVRWQASMLVIAAFAIGIPLGVVGGRWAWTALAERVGVVPAPQVPVLSVLLIVPAALLLANLVAAIPGRIAAHTQPALVLRAE